MEIRALAADEGELLRTVRLHALADSPESFVTPLADEQLLGADEWSQRAAAPDQVVFVTLAADGEAVGMAGGHPRAEERGVIGVWGMWVAPRARRTGLGGRLLDAVDAWAAARGATTLRLGVMADVPGAVRFYERLGFTCVGERRLSRDPARRWYEMRRPVGAPPA